MSNFRFLKQLSKEKTDGLEEYKSNLIKNIKYSEYDIEMHDKNIRRLYIPIREAENFEQSLTELYIITETDLKSLMRRYNGVTEI